MGQLTEVPNPLLVALLYLWDIAPSMDTSEPMDTPVPCAGIQRLVDSKPTQVGYNAGLLTHLSGFGIR